MTATDTPTLEWIDSHAHLDYEYPFDTATYLDRATADLADALARIAAGDDARPVLDRLLIDLGATDDVLALAITRLARAMALAALGDPGAAEAEAEADAALADLGITAAGWRRLFGRILTGGTGGPDAPLAGLSSSTP